MSHKIFKTWNDSSKTINDQPRTRNRKKSNSSRFKKSKNCFWRFKKKTKTWSWRRKQIGNESSKIPKPEMTHRQPTKTTFILLNTWKTVFAVSKKLKTVLDVDKIQKSEMSHRNFRNWKWVIENSKTGNESSFHRYFCCFKTRSNWRLCFCVGLEWKPRFCKRQKCKSSFIPIIKNSISIATNLVHHQTPKKPRLQTSQWKYQNMLLPFQNISKWF